ncbi:putative PDDEXK endonuclease [Methylomagnum sp.]
MKTKATTRAKPINSRAKGAGAEREFSRLVFDHLGVALARNLEQSRKGGHDLLPTGEGPVSLTLDAYAIEIKRYRAITPALLAGFWRQATEQAERAGKVPVLAFREDRQEWRVLLPLVALNAEVFGPWPGLDWTAAVSVPAFCCLIRERAAGGSEPGRA